MAVIGAAVSAASCCGTAIYNRKQREAARAARFLRTVERPAREVELDPRDCGGFARAARPIDRDLARWIDATTSDARDALA